MNPQTLGALLRTVLKVLMDLNKIIIFSFVAFLLMLERDSIDKSLPIERFCKAQVRVDNSIESITTLKDSVEIAVRVGNINKDTASTNLVIANKGLRLVLKGYPKDFAIRIIQFSVTVIDRNMDTIATDVMAIGNLFTNEQVNQLKRLVLR